MAAWQFNLTVLPKIGILEHYDMIPERLAVAYSDEKYWTYRKDFIEKIWLKNSISPLEIAHEVDKLVRRASYSSDDHYSWKTYIAEKGKEMDNDANLVLDENGTIKDFHFRPDVREKGWVFLAKMIDLGEKYDWLFMDIYGNIVAPNKIEVKSLLEKSYTYLIMTGSY